MESMQPINSRGSDFRRRRLHRKSSHDSRRQTTVLEVHLINKKIDLYTKEVEVIFLKTIRGDQTFENTDELKKQIACDLEAIDRAPSSGVKTLSWKDAHTDLHPHE